MAEKFTRFHLKGSPAISYVGKKMKKHELESHVKDL